MATQTTATQITLAQAIALSNTHAGWSKDITITAWHKEQQCYVHYSATLEQVTHHPYILASYVQQGIWSTFDIHTSVDQWIIIRGLNKATQELDTFTFPNRIPEAFPLTNKITNEWEWYAIFTDTELHSKCYTALESAAASHIMPVQRKAIAASLALQLDAVVQCPQTGISYTVALPTPSTAPFSMLHPLAIYANVKQLAQSYIKTGVKMETQLSAQVMAGMLITTLAEKGLCYCKEPIRANAFLASVDAVTLSYALRAFMSMTTTVHMPKLSLTLDTGTNESMQADKVLINYLRACRGETVNDAPAYIVASTTAKTKTTVRIYTDKVRQEFKTVRSATTNALALITKLEAMPSNKAVSTSYWTALRLDAKMLTYLSPKAKTAVIARIHANIAGSLESSELAKLFETTTSNNIQADLGTISMELQDTTPTTSKVSFSAALAKVIAKGTQGDSNE